MGTPNVLSAITPEVWETVLQDNLYKSLVSFGVANVSMRMPLGYGDVINKQYFDSLTAAAYTPGSTTLAMDEVRFASDQLTVNNKYYTAFYVDDMDQLQANVDIQRSLLEEMTYQLKTLIDTNVLYNTSAGTTAAHGQMVYGAITDYHLTPLTASSGNIVTVFANARRLLMDGNVEDFGDWCAILNPLVAAKLSQKSTGLGFNFADAALKNGYIGDFMGFQIYVSNNLSSVIEASATRNLTGLGTITDLYFGRKGQIEVVMQQSPKIEIKDVHDQIGKNIICWTLWGDTVYTRGKSRFLDVVTDITANGA